METTTTRSTGVRGVAGPPQRGRWGCLSDTSWWRVAASLLLLVLLGVAARRSLQAPVSISPVPVGTVPSAIAVDARTGHAFVTNLLDDTVTMFDTRSGAVLRTIAVGHGPGTVVVAGRAGRAFVLNQGDDSLSVLDTATGAVLRTMHLPDLNVLAVDDQHSHVFVASGADQAAAGTLIMLDARSGTVLHTAPLGGRPGWYVQSLVVDPGMRRVLVPLCANGAIAVFDAVGGRPLPSLRVGGCPKAVTVDLPAYRLAVTDPDNATVSLLDARGGTSLRHVTLGGIPQAVAVDARSQHVFVTDDADGTVSMLDARSGAVLQVRTVGTTPMPVPALSCLHATGAGRLSASCVSVVAAATDARRVRVFILTAPDDPGLARGRRGRAVADAPQPGDMSVLDAASGRLRHVVTVGVSPVAMAVDEASGHLFVVNQGSADPPGNAAAAGRSRPGGPAWLPSWLGQWLRPWAPWLDQPAPPNTHGSVSVLDLRDM